MTATQQRAWAEIPFVGFSRRTGSIWSSFCDHCRLTSVDAIMSRTLQDTIAWDAAGPVLAYWNETLFPMITEYRNKNAREILKGHPWNGSVDCWMVGRAATEAVPHIIINCPHEKVAKRYEKLIKNDPIIQGSGFRICRRRGNIRYRTSRSGKTPDLSVPAVSGGEISDEGYAMPTNQDAALTAGQPPQERQYPRYPSAPAPYSGGYSVVGPGPGYDLSAVRQVYLCTLFVPRKDGMLIGLGPPPYGFDIPSGPSATSQHDPAS